jgi:hypothetical protein
MLKSDNSNDHFTWKRFWPWNWMGSPLWHHHPAKQKPVTLLTKRTVTSDNSDANVKIKFYFRQANFDVVPAEEDFSASINRGKSCTLMPTVRDWRYGGNNGTKAPLMLLIYAFIFRLTIHSVAQTTQRRDTVQQHTGSVPGFLPRRPTCSLPGQSTWDLECEEALGQGFLRVVRAVLFSIIPPLLIMYWSFIWGR